MIREKNYSLIKAIRESGCGSKGEGEGGASENPGWRRSPKSLTSNQSQGIVTLAIYTAIPVVIILDWIFESNGPAVE